MRLSALRKTGLIALFFSILMLASAAGYAASMHGAARHGAPGHSVQGARAGTNTLIAIYTGNETLGAAFKKAARRMGVSYVTLGRGNLSLARRLASSHKLILVVDVEASRSLDCSLVRELLSSNGVVLVVGSGRLGSFLAHCPGANLTLRIVGEGGAPEAALAVSAVPVGGGLLAPYYRFYGMTVSPHEILSNELRVARENVGVDAAAAGLVAGKGAEQVLEEGLPWDETMLTWYYVGIVEAYNLPVICSVNDFGQQEEFLAGYMSFRALFASAWLNDVSYGIPYEYKIGVEEILKSAGGAFGNPMLPITSPVTIGKPEKVDLVLPRGDECISDMYPYEETEGPLHALLHYLQATAQAIRERTFPLDTDGGIDIRPREYMAWSETYHGLRNSRGVFEWGQVLPLIGWPKSDGRAGIAYYVESKDPLEAVLNVTGSMVYRRLWPPFSTHSCIVYKWFRLSAYYDGPLVAEGSGGGNNP